MKIFITSFEPPQRNVKQFFSFFLTIIRSLVKPIMTPKQMSNYLFKVKNEKCFYFWFWAAVCPQGFVPNWSRIFIFNEVFDNSWVEQKLLYILVMWWLKWSKCLNEGLSLSPLSATPTKCQTHSNKSSAKA